MERRPDEPAARRCLIALATYHVATGPLPFVSRRAFEAVSGRKREWWLVQALGAMITVVGATVLRAVSRRRVTPEIEMLAGGCAASLVAIDLVYVSRGRISPVYAADALVQGALVAGVLRERARR